jgi:phenylacetate-CoA ligase
LPLNTAWAAPYHRARLAAAFGDRAGWPTMGPDALQCLPVTTKADLATAGKDAAAVPLPGMDEATTSGSNGEAPFSFYLDRERSVREIAFVNDVWARAGYGEKDVRAVFRGFRLDGGQSHEWEPALRELRLSVFPLDEPASARYLDLIESRNIRFIHGYPSAIEIFCRNLLKLGRRPKVEIAGIFPISEPVLAHQRSVFAQVFPQAAVLPFYGLSERVLFASEVVDQPDVYEFEPLYGLAELLDASGRPIVTPGQEGRIVGTGFISTGMPFIRYDTQDRAVLEAAATRANGWRLRVRALNPRRKPDFLIGSDGRRIATTDLTPEDPAIVAGIGEFQFRQDLPGRCMMRFVLDAAGTQADAERLRGYIADKLEGKLRVDMAQVGSLLSGTHGKRSFIDQQLDIAQF